MKKKRGFTLIELLAVIVILAIIALIATPIVLNLINEARRGAFKRSAEGVLKSAKLSYTNSLLQDTPVTDMAYYCDGNSCKSNNSKELSVSGSVGTGDVYVYANGEVAFTLTNDMYCAAKSRETDKINVTKGNCDNIDITNDTTPPVIKQINRIKNSNSITLTIVAEEDLSTIKGYSCKMDDEEFTEITNVAFCKFEGLAPNSTHTFVVRVYNKLPNKEGYDSEKNMTEQTTEESTSLLPTPVIEVENYTTWTSSKKVTIYYNGKDENADMSGITSSYVIEKDGVEIASGTGNEIILTDNVTVTAINRDENNHNVSQSAVIDTIYIPASSVTYGNTNVQADIEELYELLKDL